jgi:hypothetical protein
VRPCHRSRTECAIATPSSSSASGEQLNDPGLEPIEFDGFRKQAGLNRFILTAKRWIDATGATGLLSRAGRYGGTYAYKDIAFEFASWISVEFKLYLIKEFQEALVEIEKKIAKATNTHNDYLRELGLAPIPLATSERG